MTSVSGPYDTNDNFKIGLSTTPPTALYGRTIGKLTGGWWGTPTAPATSAAPVTANTKAQTINVAPAVEPTASEKPTAQTGGGWFSSVASRVPVLGRWWTSDVTKDTKSVTTSKAPEQTLEKTIEPGSKVTRVDTAPTVVVTGGNSEIPIIKKSGWWQGPGWGKGTHSEIDPESRWAKENSEMYTAANKVIKYYTPAKTSLSAYNERLTSAGLDKDQRYSTIGKTIDISTIGEEDHKWMRSNMFDTGFEMANAWRDKKGDAACSTLVDYHEAREAARSVPASIISQAEQDRKFSKMQSTINDLQSQLEMLLKERPTWAKTEPSSIVAPRIAAPSSAVGASQATIEPSEA